MKKELPEDITALLLPYGLNHEEDILYWMMCDRELDGGYTETYLILTKDTFFFTDTLKVESIPIHEIDSIKVVHLVASGMIVVRTTEDTALAAFTNGSMGKAAKFVTIFTKLKKGEEVREEDKREEERKNAACPQCGMIYPVEGRPVCPKCMKKHAVFLRLLGFAAPHKRSIILIILFMLLNSATGLAIPYLQGTVLFDQALGGSGAFAGKIGLVVLLIIGFRTLSLLFGISFGVVNARMAANVAFDLKASIFASMQRLSLAFFQKKQTGQLMTRVNNDANELQYFFVDGISYFIVNAMNILGITIILMMMDWKLTLVCFLPLPFVVLMVRKAFPKLWRLSWRRHKKVSILNSIISDTVRGTRIVKAFGKEKREMERFQRANTSFSEAEQSLNKLGSTVFPILTLVTQSGGVLIWAFGGWKVMQGDITFGEIMTFISYIYMLYGPIQFMNNIVNWWSYCMSAAQRIFEIQDAVPDIVEKDDPVCIEQLQGDIRVVNVSFGYEPVKPILKEVCLHAKPGQMIGIVGHSGAGKSTLVNLISRLYDVTGGDILLDGVNVKDLSSFTLRKHIGIVSQEVFVFMGTIAENIAYANPDCTVSEIIHAAKIANAHDFIEKLPDGYDTFVGTGGHNLSGGEKQRIAIARAILHNPKILILDEATASLDTETELQIQEALESLMKGRTTIAIAHRLSTLRNADYLYVMDKGSVVEAGTHHELMSCNGTYAGMVSKHEEALKMKEVV